MGSESEQPAQRPGGEPGSPGPAPKYPWLAWLAFLVIMATWVGLPTQREAIPQLPYSEFKSLVGQGKVGNVTLTGDRIEGERTEAPVSAGSGSSAGGGSTSAFFRSRVPALGDDNLLGLLEAHQVEVNVQSAEVEGFWGRLLLSLLPWMIIFGLYFIWLRPMSRNMTGGLGQRGLGGFLKGGAKPQESRPKTRFEDVAGQESAKREVTELVDFLRDPDRYHKLGASVPRGVLLKGPPGTGKTLLARALAGEAEVPFFSVSASEFIEVFVGVGASRVRELFKAARASAPSILFIDELDSIGRARGTGLGGGHDEREQTLNQILAELDGFSGKEAVIVLAATNRPDVLDPALMRPGRFDRHVELDLPDRAARRAILDIHVREVPLAKDVDLDSVASGTPGFSGADLKNLVNEAAMRAARLERSQVVAEDFDSMRDRVLMGAERTLAISPAEKHRLAVHEAGHTAAAFFLAGADPLYKVSIIPRGRALGGTQQLPTEERHTLDEAYLRARLVVMLAGRAAEDLLLDTVSSGAEDDIRQSTALARAMASRWGMVDSIGPVDLRDSDEHPFLGREIAQPRRHSEASARAVDTAVNALLQEAHEQATEVLAKHRDSLGALVLALERRETLYKADIDAVLGDPRPDNVSPLRLAEPAPTPQGR